MMHKRNNVKKIIVFLFAGVIFLSNLYNVIPASGIIGSGNSEKSLASKSNDVWSDDQWKFYTIDVEAGETVIINLTYSGDLDLDLRIFVDEDALKIPDEQTNFAKDITHCGLPEVAPLKNSQTRGYQGVVGQGT